MVGRTFTACSWLGALLALGVLVSATAAQGSADAERKYAEEEKQFGKLRVKVKDASNRETAVFDKVVVAHDKAVLANKPDGETRRVAEWSIFYRLKDDDGNDRPVDGWVRVGSSSGKPVGWIKEEHVKPWQTRFLLEVLQPDKDSTFTVHTDKNEKIKLSTIPPKGYARLALVTKKPEKEEGDDTDYPVMIYTGRLSNKIGGPTDLSDLKLEIVFVIESTDFMKLKYGDRELFSYLKDLIKDVVDDLSNSKELQGAVRLGFVEYQDNVSNKKFTSKLTCDLTDDYRTFTTRLDTLAATSLNDDWVDDVIAGLNTAVVEPKWSKNSVKHIILLGASSCHLKKRGEQDPHWKQFGGIENKMTLLAPKEIGFSSTGLSIRDLVSKGTSAGGADDVKIRLSKTFHAMQMEKPEDVPPQLLAKFPDLQELVDKHKDLIDKIATMSDKEIDAKQQELATELKDPEKAQWVVLFCTRKRLASYQAKLAKQQYEELSKNNGYAPGLFIPVEPSAGKVKEASSKLGEELKLSFRALSKLRDGESIGEGGAKSALTLPFWKLEQAEGGKPRDLRPAEEGKAQVRDANGRQVAVRCVMVTEPELRRLKSVLETLHKNFEGMSDPTARKDAGKVLAELKSALALASIGQQSLDEGTELQTLITDLPLKTGVLKITPRDLIRMPPDAFKNWLERLKVASKRAEDLLDSKDKFSYTSQEAVNDKIIYLELSALP